MLKKDLRLKFLAERALFLPKQISELSLEISNKALQIPIWDYTNYHLFLSIPQKNEVDTSYLLSILHGKDKNIIVSKMVGEIDLTHFLLTDNTLIKINKWNVPEPVDGIEINPSKIDVVFIPLLAFDTKGNRIGYGKGYYDNFLSQCRKDVLKVGLSFFEPVVTIADVLESDVPLDYCVTPNKIYKF
tara:strand:+ start:11201 stop:11761 length:561 start_codon:yes stop_codon:yes gene_type:complete